MLAHNPPLAIYSYNLVKSVILFSVYPSERKITGKREHLSTGFFLEAAFFVPN